MIDVRAAEPIFDIVEGGYYVGFWFLAGRGQDFLGMLFKNPDDAGLRLRYRFRYYKDDKVHFDETDDEKSVYDVDLSKKSEDEAISIVDGLAQELINKDYLGTKLPWLVKKRYTRKIVRGGNRAAGEALLKMPFVHTKPLTNGRN